MAVAEAVVVGMAVLGWRNACGCCRQQRMDRADSNSLALVVEIIIILFK